MTKKSNTRKSLIASLASITLCLAMLIGSTFAWFTDSASTSVNTIQAGTLDIMLLDAENENATDLAGKTLGFVKEDGTAIDNSTILWEPGCRYILQQAWLYNKGNLNATYQVVISGVTSGQELAQVLDVYVEDQPCGTLANLVSNGGIVKEGIIAPNAFETFGKIELRMKEEAGNEYQGKSLEGIAITVYATQAPVEKDSYDNQYDANAEYDMSVAGVVVTEGGINVPDDETLVISGGTVNDYQLIENSGDGVVIDNVNFTGTAVVWGEGKTVTINGGTFKATAVAVGDGAPAPVVINGGYFDVGSIDADTGVPVTINGGTFTCDPSGFVAAGKTATQNGDGTWTVA